MKHSLPLWLVVWLLRAEIALRLARATALRWLAARR
jgi:hypothetical protein